MFDNKLKVRNYYKFIVIIPVDNCDTGLMKHGNNNSNLHDWHAST